jgi:hypothetical protein
MEDLAEVYKNTCLFCTLELAHGVTAGVTAGAAGAAGGRGAGPVSTCVHACAATSCTHREWRATQWCAVQNYVSFLYS